VQTSEPLQKLAILEKSLYPDESPKVFGDNNVEEKEERGEEGRKERREKVSLKTKLFIFRSKLKFSPKPKPLVNGKKRVIRKMKGRFLGL